MPSSKEKVNYDDAVWEQARRLGMDPGNDEEFFWLAEESLRAPLPEGWEMANDEERGLPYFYNETLGRTQWDHPSDEHYREEYIRLRQRRQDEELDSIVDSFKSPSPRKIKTKTRKRYPGTRHDDDSYEKQDEDFDDSITEDSRSFARNHSSAKNRMSSPPKARVLKPRVVVSRARPVTSGMQESLPSKSRDTTEISPLKNNRTESKDLSQQKLPKEEEEEKRGDDDIESPNKLLSLAKESEARLSAEVDALRKRLDEAEKRDSARIAAARAETAKAHEEASLLNQKLSDESRAKRRAEERAERAETELKTGILSNGNNQTDQKHAFKLRDAEEKVSRLQIELDTVQRQLSAERVSQKENIKMIEARHSADQIEAQKIRHEAQSLKLELQRRRREFDTQATELRLAREREVQYQKQIATLRANTSSNTALVSKEHLNTRSELHEAQSQAREFELAARLAEDRAAAAETHGEGVRSQLAESQAALSSLRHELSTRRRHEELTIAPIQHEKMQIENELMTAKAETKRLLHELELSKQNFEHEKKMLAAEAKSQLLRVASEAATVSEEEWTSRLKLAAIEPSKQLDSVSEQLQDAQSESAALRESLAELQRSASKQIANEKQQYEKIQVELHIKDEELMRCRTELDRVRHLLAKEYQEAELRRAYEIDAIIAVAGGPANANLPLPPGAAAPTLRMIQERLDTVKAQVRDSVLTINHHSTQQRSLLPEMVQVADDTNTYEEEPPQTPTKASAKNPQTPDAINALVASARRSRPSVTNGANDIYDSMYSSPAAVTKKESASQKLRPYHGHDSSPGYHRGYWQRVYGDGGFDDGGRATFHHHNSRTTARIKKHYSSSSPITSANYTF